MKQLQTTLLERLTEAGISVSRLAILSETSKADVSHYIHGRKRKIGWKRKRRIFRVLCELGLAKQRLYHPPVCRNCGLAYPTQQRK